MADTKTSAEAAAAALDGSELVRVVQGGANAKATVAQISDYINALTQGEADALYAPITVTQYTDEMARDAIGATLVAGTNITLTVNDGANTITIDAAGGGGYTDEQARDALGTALTAGAGITVTPNDGADTIAIACTITQYTDELVDDRVAALIQNGTGITWTYNDGAGALTPAVTITQYTDEMVDDRVAALIQNGTGITWTYNDAGGTLTPAVSITQYTDELAQDAIGGILVDTATIDFTYDDATPQITADVKNGSITFAKMQAITDQRLLGAQGGTTVEEISVSTGLSLAANALSCTITQYTDELAQDAVGAMIDTSLTYVDGTPLLQTTKASTTEVLTGTDAVKAVTSDALAALWEQGSNIASAATISVGEGGYFLVTGTTNISDIDFATDKAGRTVWLRFNGILDVVHSATLIVLGGANLTTADGMVCGFVSEGADVVRMITAFSPSLPASRGIQSEVEALSDIRVSTPARMHWHPGVAKCWGKVGMAGGALDASYNMTSVTDGGVGLVTFTIATDFSSANWAFSVSIENIDASIDASTDNQIVQVGLAGQAAGTLAMICGDAIGTAAVDATKWHMVGFGDQ